MPLKLKNTLLQSFPTPLGEMNGQVDAPTAPVLLSCLSSPHVNTRFGMVHSDRNDISQKFLQICSELLTLLRVSEDGKYSVPL